MALFSLGMTSPQILHFVEFLRGKVRLHAGGLGRLLLVALNDVLGHLLGRHGLATV